MYSNVKSCVKHVSPFSDYFSYAVGHRQGEVMSPLLFSLFIEDLELYLQDDVNCGIAIDDSRGVDNVAAGVATAAPLIWLVVVIQKCRAFRRPTLLPCTFSKHLRRSARTWLNGLVRNM